MTAILEVKDLAHAKSDGHPILSAVNFIVNEGDIVVLKGVSGSGCVRSYCVLIIQRAKTRQLCRITGKLRCSSALHTSNFILAMYCLRVNLQYTMVRGQRLAPSVSRT